jgi:hypothetical protein
MLTVWLRAQPSFLSNVVSYHSALSGNSIADAENTSAGLICGFMSRPSRHGAGLNIPPRLRRRSQSDRAD